MAPAPADATPRPERDPRPGLSGLEPGVLEAWFRERCEPAYRARQVADAVWGGRAAATGEARTLPNALRAEVDAAFRFDTVADTELQTADAGLTEKALHRLSDGALIESVLMHYRSGPASGSVTRCASRARRAALSAARSARRVSSASPATSRRPRSSTRSGMRRGASPPTIAA